MLTIIIRFNDGCINRAVPLSAVSKLSFVLESQSADHSAHSSPHASPSAAVTDSRQSVDSARQSSVDIRRILPTHPRSLVSSPSSPALSSLVSSAVQSLSSSPSSPALSSLEVASDVASSVQPKGVLSSVKTMSLCIDDLRKGFMLWFESERETVRWLGTLQNLSAMPLKEQKV